MIRFIVKYDVNIFGQFYHNEFVFKDYDTALNTYINMCKDKDFTNISIVKEIYKLVSCEVVK